MSIHVRSYPESRQLFLAVFLHVAFSSFFGVISSVKRVAPGGVCMMPRFFVPPASVPRPSYGARLLFFDIKYHPLFADPRWIRPGKNRTLHDQVKFASRLSVYVFKPQFNMSDMESSVGTGLSASAIQVRKNKL